MALATRKAKHWHEAGKVGWELAQELEDAKARLNLDCAKILPMRTSALGKSVVVSIPIDCSECENPTTAEVALLLTIV